MKLQDWFDQQAKTSPSDLQKMRMYQRFLDKSHRSISYHKISYYAKVAVFSIGLFLLGGTVYYSGKPLGTPYEIAIQGDAYTTLQGQPGKFVQADTIGQIISTEGRIQITHNNTEIETERLSSNDRVLLAEGAEMYFRIDEHIHAKITGPAEFVLEDAGNQEGVKKYIINLISGDYLEVVTIPVEPVEEITLEEPTPQVTVKAEDFTIEQVDTRGTMDLVISTTDDGKKQVSNKGTEVVIKKIVAEKQTYVAIQKDEVVAVNERVEFVDVVKQPEEILTELEESKFTVRYEIQASENTSDIASEVLFTKESLKKKVASEELLDYVRTSLNAGSLQRYISQMTKYQASGDIDAFAIAYSNFLKRLDKGYKLAGGEFSFPTLSIDTLPQAITLTQQLATLLETQWYIDPSLLQGLRATAVSLANISLVERSQEEHITDATPLPKNNISTVQKGGDNTDVDTEVLVNEDAPQEDTLEDVLQGVVDPTQAVQ